MMTTKKTRITSKSFESTNVSFTRPSTAVRAGLTADIKLTRGRQLVEHGPLSLIPDPNNPRPGEVIDDLWLKKYLKLGTEESLCHFVESSGEYYIPPFSDLSSEVPIELHDDYEFLRELAYSIRNDGIIEPIEIFLADKKNDPEYFLHSKLDYGYVVLEGHQRRLAAIIAGITTVTCIEITDETMLARLKVKHRKLRRQLAENNLRKGLSVGQNFKIVCSLLSGSVDSANITSKELSSIVGLNEYISGALKRLAMYKHEFPPAMINLVEQSLVSFKWIRTWVGKSQSEIQTEIDRLTSNLPPPIQIDIKKGKARGRSGGAVKRSAVFKITAENDAKDLQTFLFNRIPELRERDHIDVSFNELEKVLARLMELARSQY